MFLLSCVGNCSRVRSCCTKGNIVPISTVISAILIWVAFKAAYVEKKLSEIFTKKKPRRLDSVIAYSVPSMTLGIASVQHCEECVYGIADHRCLLPRSRRSPDGQAEQSDLSATS